MRTIPSTLMMLGLCGVVGLGCASSGATTATGDAQAKIEAEQKRVAELESQLDRTRGDMQKLESDLRSAQAASGVPISSGAGGDLFPPNAKPGECYTRAFIPPTYETKSVQKLKTAASESVKIVPATYAWTEERVATKEASSRLEVIPATYDMVTERVLVKEASKKLVNVAAEYGYDEERVLVKAAHTVWKKGRGPIERVDQSTGEIMCLVEVPAEYKTVRTRVLRKPATTREIPIPAEYKTVKRRVQVKPATTREITIPAVYQTVKVRKLATPPREVRSEIPARYQTVTMREQVSEGRLEWRPVLCETNATPGTVASIQRALKTAGHNPGPIDGVIGTQTLAAVKSFQVQKSLPQGGLNYSTISALGVKVGR